jgi:hypothetical protein
MFRISIQKITAFCYGMSPSFVDCSLQSLSLLRKCPSVLLCFCLGVLLLIAVSALFLRCLQLVNPQVTEGTHARMGPKLLVQ